MPPQPLDAARHITRRHFLDRCKVGLGGLAAAHAAANAAKTPLYLATAPELAEVSGKYFVRRKPVRSSRASRDAETARRLWWASEVLTAASDT